MCVTGSRLCDDLDLFHLDGGDFPLKAEPKNGDDGGDNEDGVEPGVEDIEFKITEDIGDDLTIFEGEIDSH